MNTEEIKDLYRTVMAARVDMADSAPLEDGELEVLRAALKLEAALILLLATKPNYFENAL